MRTIKQVGQFKRDLKREARGQRRIDLAKEFVTIVETLANDKPLTEKFRDHALPATGKTIAIAT
jgi:mRNA interferase YafQ